MANMMIPEACSEQALRILAACEGFAEFHPLRLEADIEAIESAGLANDPFWMPRIGFMKKTVADVRRARDRELATLRESRAAEARREKEAIERERAKRQRHDANLARRREEDHQRAVGMGAAKKQGDGKGKKH